MTPIRPLPASRLDPVLKRLGVVLALALAACAGPSAAAGPATAAPSAPVTRPPAFATPSPTPPPAPLAAPYSCTERVALPEVRDVIGVSWAPDGTKLALARTVTLPRQFTGTPEDFLIDSLDLSTGELTPIALGEQPQWSGSGRYLAYRSWDEELKIGAGEDVVASPHSTMPSARWAGDVLYFFDGDAIQAWEKGAVRTVARLPAGFGLTYPHDDAYFSADAKRFTITRYRPDGTVWRFLGTTADGSLAPIDGDALYVEWAPAGESLLLRYADRFGLRDADGATAVLPFSKAPGPVTVWAADGETVLVGAVSAAAPGTVRFDTFAAWGAEPAAAAGALPNLVGPRGFSPDGRFFAGASRTGGTTRLELFRCGTPPSGASLATGGAPAPADGKVQRPAVGAITQLFHPGHTGLDVAAPFGSLLTAVEGGTVSAVGPVAVGGRRVCVRQPNGLESCIYHTAAPLVGVGQQVARGQPVALVGMTGETTGPHVHWEIAAGGTLVDPLSR